MQRILLAGFSAAVSALVFSSCTSSRGPVPTIPLEKKQIEALAARAKPPQMFGLTVYPSDAGPVFGGAFRVHEGDVAAITFPHGERTYAPLVKVGIVGEPDILALLDTASPQSWATLPMMSTLQIQLLAAPSLLVSSPQHVFDSIVGILGVAAHIKVDQAGVENALFQVRAAMGPIGPLGRGLDVAKLDLVLGADLLKAFNHVQFNFPARFVTLSATAGYRPNESNLLATVPLTFTNGMVAVEGVLQGEPATFVLDTGGDYAIALPTNRPAGTVKQVSVGDLVMRDMPGVPGMDLALGPIATPRIGRQALSRFKMTLDFRNRQIVFEKP